MVAIVRRTVVAGALAASLLAGAPALAAATGSPLASAPTANAFSPSAPGIQGVTNSSVPAPTDPATAGSFSPPFAEPGPVCPNETEGSDPNAQTRRDIICKPAAVNVIALPNNKILYWDGVEASEQLQYSVVFEAGSKAVNDQSRQLAINYSDPFKSVWARPSPVDGGANDRKNYQYLVQNAPGPTKQMLNDPGSAPGALFCSVQEILSNGDVLVPGGTGFISEPRFPNSQYGLAEFQGLHSTRIYHPATNTWTQAGDMHWGRWYPSLVTLPDGRVMVVSGVSKLWKPVYPQHPLDSGSNVKETEVFDPKTGQWTANPASASYSLPLYPRIHLLPDGNVYYDAGGGTFDFFGQSYDEALWNLAAVYNAKTQSWRQIGVPWTVSVDSGRPLDTALAAGFRNDAFSIMLPLEPDAHGNYTKASFLSAGGVLGTATGTYLANTSSEINTVDTSKGDTFSSRPTGPLNNARWFSTGVLLPTGQVMTFNGANRDEVVEPGTGFAVKDAEMFDPATGRWSRMAAAHDERTYHNTAMLLPSGQVLVGGHAPLPFMYGKDQTGPAGLSNNFRDPSFELYDPPYLHWGIPQPTLHAADSQLRYGQSLAVATPQASSIRSVVLVRNPAVTHLIDGDQRNVVLPILQRSNGSLTVQVPKTGAVVPPGPYLLFVNQATKRGLIPSKAQQVWVR